ncbi:MAG: radical SAM protein, partial [Syntrophales bacterium]|nr:radical SAM protein [Syntrophales bacterium]
MIQEKNKYTFGPVPSRRLGRSLGVDLVPFKTCTYNCIYCQLGRTTSRTTALREFLPAEDIIGEVAQRLQEIPRPDYITLSGSGEPTLYSRIGDIISGVKKISDIPVAVLTNGSLFWIDEVRDAVQGADLLIPSLDAGDEKIFSYVNRPHPDISFKKMAEGLCKLRECFDGPIWLEVFLVGGVTDIKSEVLKIKKWVNRIAPERVQLNTAVRTPAEGFVDTVSKEKMEEMRSLFGPRCEVIADYSGTHNIDEFYHTQGDVFELLRRRPCSVDDISSGLNLHR